MLRRLAQNTAISAVTFGITGALGLLVVGVIVRAYGLSAFGLIVLVRNLLPVGFLALIDFGVSETTTQAVARARGGGNWVVAGEKVALLLAGAFCIGLLSGCTLWFGASSFAALFRVAPEQAAVFATMVRLTGLALLIAFPGLVFEGILKGFENYGWLRLVEIVGIGSYVAAVLAIVSEGMAYQWVAYSFTTMIICKYLVLGLVAWRVARNSPLRFHHATIDSRRDLSRRSWLMFAGRIVGILQNQLPPLAIGMLLGSGAVGIYDVLTRLPRFLKSVLGLLSSAILPVSARVEEASDTGRRQMLARSGFVLPAAIAIPGLTVVGLFSQEILTHWIGVSAAAHWPWMSLMLLVPAVGVLLGSSQTALLIRPDFLRATLKLVFLQTAIQYAVTLAFLSTLDQFAFIFGQVLASVTFTPLLAKRIFDEWEMPLGLFWNQLARHTANAAILVAAVAMIKFLLAPLGLYELTIVIGLCCVAGWGLSYAIVLSSGDRAMFGRVLRSLHRI